MTIPCQTVIDSPFNIVATQVRGKGAFGQVYSGEATYSKNGSTVTAPIVIKQIRINPPVMPVPTGYTSVRSDAKISSLKEAEDEFNSTKSLRTSRFLRYAVRPYAFFKDNDFAYIVMEDGGETLDSYVAKIKNSDNFLRSYIELAKQLKNAIDALHYIGYVHLDLHPGNILINKNKRLKLIDFGLTKKIDAPISIAGNSLYRDPHILTIKRAYRAYDDFSAAIILSEILNGTSILKEVGETVEPGNDKYTELTNHYSYKINQCLSDMKCSTGTYFLLQSQNPDINKRTPLKNYINILKKIKLSDYE